MMMMLHSPFDLVRSFLSNRTVRSVCTAHGTVQFIGLSLLVIGNWKLEIGCELMFALHSAVSADLAPTPDEAYKCRVADCCNCLHYSICCVSQSVCLQFVL
jgi:hypothetical protein